METGGGSGSLPAVIVCCIVSQAIKNKYSCLPTTTQKQVIMMAPRSPHTRTASNTLLEVLGTSLQGQKSKVCFPTSVGSFKTKIKINYCGGTNNKTQAQHVEVYELKIYSAQQHRHHSWRKQFVIFGLALQAVSPPIDKSPSKSHSGT
jgi:hypothetical protein